MNQYKNQYKKEPSLSTTPRILFTAPSSGSGKTLITCGILMALKNRRLNIAAFKCGPDYIDPMFHETILDTKSRNLDLFLTSKEIVNYLLSTNSEGMDLAVLEGVMGYYDGLAGTSTDASTYDISVVTNTPSVLIVSCKGMSVSLLPLIKGFLDYKDNHTIKGVILNGISSMFYPDIKNLIERELRIPVYGYVPMVKELVIESRHLGLITPGEIKSLKEKLQSLSAILEDTLDMDGLLNLANSAPPIIYRKPIIPSFSPNKIRIAVAKDEAFCFYYEDNFSLLKEMGAELIFFSPLRESTLPKDIKGIILGGGYPEIYAKELSENISMLESIRSHVAKGVFLYAECGGFMYLHTNLEDTNQIPYPMLGLIKGTAFKTEKLSRFGYITLTAREDNPLCQVGESVNAHEFHYWDSTECGNNFQATKPYRNRSYECIHTSDHIFAGYPHIHFFNNINMCYSLLKRCDDVRVQ